MKFSWSVAACRAFPRSASQEVFLRINFGISLGIDQVVCPLAHNTLPSATQRVQIVVVLQAIVQNSVVVDGDERLR